MEMPKEGTPLWYLLQIRELRGQPAPKTTDLAELRKYRHERNEKFIELATQTIAKTHSNPEMSEAFNLAVQELMEARLQNALQGSEEDIALLYEEVDMFIQRDAKSFSAMTASHTLVRFAHTNAMRYAAQEPKWITEFSRKARQFAGSFPKKKRNHSPCSLRLPLPQNCTASSRKPLLVIRCWLRNSPIRHRASLAWVSCVA
jgi:hypothetical protein